MGAMPRKPLRDEQFRVAVESATDSTVLADETGLITFVNPATESLFGYSEGELVGQRIEMLMPERLRSAHRAGLERVVTTGTSRMIGDVVNLTGLRKDGEEFVLELALASGRIEGRLFFTGVLRDVTLRRQSEQVRAAQLAVTRSLAEADSMLAAAPKILGAICDLLGMDVGNLWLLDDSAPVLRCKSTRYPETLKKGSFRKITGSWAFRRGEGLPGRVWETGRPAAIENVVADTNSPRAAAAAADDLHGAFGFPILVGQEVVGVLEFLSHRPMKGDAAMLEVLGAMGSQIGQFVQRKGAERSTFEQRESLATTLHSIGDGVVATDVDGRVVRMNPVAERLTGWTLAEAAGTPAAEIFRVINEETRASIRCPVARALREGTVVELENHALLIRRDGSEQPIADSCAPIRAADGSLSGAVLVFRDVSEERRLKQLQAAAQKQMIISDRMASVGTLAAGVAHEINNPLTYVIANLEMIVDEIRLLSGGLPTGRMLEITEMAKEARQGAERVRKIVKGLKTFSRADEERRVAVDVRAVLEISVNMAFNEMRHRARLVKDYGPLPLVDGDEARLGQVFINLLVNAAQALPENNSEKNEIRITTRTDEAGNAVVEVRDNGPGIASGVLSRIFDPFFTTKPVGVGTGLGLSICHSIVTSAGGEITVASELGKGTAFRVVLCAASHDLPAVKRPSNPSQRPKPARRARVLIVDDDEGVCRVLGRVVGRDHEVVLATSGDQAIRHLQSGLTFDLILCDLMMPEMSGMEVHASILQNYPEHADRIVFVTGGAFSPAARDFLDEVPNERLEKPIDAHNLGAIVQRFVR